MFGRDGVLGLWESLFEAGWDRAAVYVHSSLLFVVAIRPCLLDLEVAPFGYLTDCLVLGPLGARLMGVLGPHLGSYGYLVRDSLF